MGVGRGQAAAWNDQRDFTSRVGFGELLERKDRP
jgi:hypothetical protein